MIGILIQACQVVLLLGIIIGVFKFITNVTFEIGYDTPDDIMKYEDSSYYFKEQLDYRKEPLYSLVHMPTKTLLVFDTENFCFKFIHQECHVEDTQLMFFTMEEFKSFGYMYESKEWKYVNRDEVMASLLKEKACK